MSAGKVMATVFWDSRGIIFIDYLEKDQTITGIYFGALLDRLKVEIEKKSPQFEGKRPFFIRIMQGCQRAQ